MLTSSPTVLRQLPEFGAEVQPGSLYVQLRRLASKSLRTLDTLLRQETWSKRAAQVEADLVSHLARGSSSPVSLFLAELRTAGDEDDALLITLAGCLRALDGWLREQARDRPSIEVRLPDSAGGDTVFLLAPPPNPIEAWIPEARQLVRTVADRCLDLRSVLDLHWLLVEPAAVRPRFAELDEAVACELRSRGDQGWRIGLAWPCGTARYNLKGDPQRRTPGGEVPYRFVEVDQEDLPAARLELEEIVRACGEHQVDILCFPELTLDRSLLQHMRALLRVRRPRRFPSLVISGSFHREGPEDSLVNRCHVLDGHGRDLWFQDKCLRYRIPAEQAGEMSPELLAELGIDRQGGHEDIRLGEELRITDTPLGRLATPICLDFFCVSRPAAGILGKLPVPAAGPRPPSGATSPGPS